MPITMDEDFGVFQFTSRQLFTPPIDPRHVVTKRIRFGEQPWAQFGVPLTTPTDIELESELSAWQAAGIESLENTLSSLGE